MPPRKKPEDEVSISWIRKNLGLIIQTTVFSVGGMLSLVKMYYAIDNRMLTNEIAIREVGEKHEQAFKVYQTDVANLREWLKAVSERTGKLEKDIAHIQGVTGIPKSAAKEGDK